jgi:hypothetical protein
MPFEHRRLIETVEAMPSLRDVAGKDAYSAGGPRRIPFTALFFLQVQLPE